MKYVLLVWAGLWRKPARTLFTFFSIAVAFLLFGSLHGITAGIDAIIDWMDPARMRVQSRGGVLEKLPVAYYSQISRIPHVASLTSTTLFYGFYRERKDYIGGVALGGGDPLATLANGIELSHEQADIFKATRTGALIGKALAEKYGWKIGDRVPLTSMTWVNRGGNFTWAFDIVGIYDIPEKPELANEFWFNYDYLEESRLQDHGMTHVFILRTDNPEYNSQVESSIDSLFANSANPTITQSDRESLKVRIRQIGDINLMVNAVVAAALFTLLFVTANTMLQSVRQRIPELAVLKTLGFSGRKVIVLVVVEALVLCLFGAFIGLLVAAGLFPLLSSAIQAPISMPLGVVLNGLAVATTVALASSFFPAFKAQRLSIVDALRRVK